MATKVTTIIVNQTKYGLIIMVGTYRRLASVKAGGEYKMQVDVNWTYQEFVLEVESTNHASMKLSVNSDDCCDYRRITVTEVDGKLDALREPRQQSVNSDGCCDYRRITVTEVDGKRDALREPRQQSVDTNSHAVVEGATVRRSPRVNGICNLLANSRWKIW